MACFKYVRKVFSKDKSVCMLNGEKGKGMKSITGSKRLLSQLYSYIVRDIGVQLKCFDTVKKAHMHIENIIGLLIG